MAEPTDSYPEEATHGGRTNGAGDGSGAGEQAVRDILDAHGEELAAALDRTDEVGDLLETTVLVVASADDEEVEYVTESTANLVRAVDGLSTDAAAELATDVGENGAELAEAMETLVAVQREGHLDDLARVATAFSESLSPEEVEELAEMLEESGTETVEALDVVLDLQREDRLDDLVALARTVSTLEIDGDTARGIDTVLGAVGEAQRTHEPVGLLGLLGELRTRDARAGLGYLVALLKAQGRRLRSE